ncbi:Synaptic functional regulator fmr1 [Cichlidogyrus casuarinus]|uniref:Synaptic functional regulator fmr1 n=1 Tax=Cichlidogyrus casuarinus TaxID=1844966 RepID=A0ABD2QA96_9PLAT
MFFVYKSKARMRVKFWPSREHRSGKTPSTNLSFYMRSGCRIDYVGFIDFAVKGKTLTAEAPPLHKGVLRHTNCRSLVTVSTDESGASFVNFYSTDEKLKEHIDLLIDDHWRSLATKRNHLRRMHLNVNSVNKRTELAMPEIPKEFAESPVIDAMTIPQSFIRFCIGLRGHYINEVRALPGIIHILVYDAPAHSYFERKDPLAWSKEAANKARARFDFVRICYRFPTLYTGRVIGRNTCNITALIEKSGVTHIFHQSEYEQFDQGILTETIYINPMAEVVYDTFIIEGLRTNANRAVLLLTSQIDHFRESVKMMSLEQAHAPPPLSKNLASRLGPMVPRSELPPRAGPSPKKPIEIKVELQPNNSPKKTPVKGIQKEVDDLERDTRRVTISPKKPTNQQGDTECAKSSPKKTPVKKTNGNFASQDIRAERNLQARPIPHNGSR